MGAVPVLFFDFVLYTIIAGLQCSIFYMQLAMNRVPLLCDNFYLKLEIACLNCN